MFQGPKGYIAQICKVHLQYGNSTTNWPFYTFFVVNSPLIYILLSMFIPRESWCTLLFLMMYPLIPRNVPSYSSWCTLLFLMMYPLIPHDVPSYSSWCALLFLMMYPLIPHDVPSYLFPKLFNNIFLYSIRSTISNIYQCYF